MERGTGLKGIDTTHTTRLTYQALDIMTTAGSSVSYNMAIFGLIVSVFKPLQVPFDVLMYQVMAAL